MPEAITLSEKLEQSLKEFANTQGKTLNQVLEEALDLYLASQPRIKPLPKMIQSLETPPKKRRQRGSAKGKIWLAPDFDEPLADFQEYLQ